MPPLVSKRHGLGMTANTEMIWKSLRVVQFCSLDVVPGKKEGEPRARGLHRAELLCQPVVYNMYHRFTSRRGSLESSWACR